MSMQYEFLENVCDILDSQRIPVTAVDRKAGPYPYYGANGVQDYVADYIFDDELVLLAEDGGNFGSKDKPIAYRVSGKCWVNNHAHVLKPKNCIDIDYFCYSIKFYDTSRLVNGATRQKLTQAAMRKMLIPMREIEIQRGIAVKIGRIEYLIQKRKDQLNRIDDLVKSQFIEMFGNPITNSQNRPTKLFIDVVKLQRGYDLPVQDRVEGVVPVYGSNGILSYHNDSRAEDGIITGRSGTIGKVYFCRGEFWPLNTTLYSVDKHGNNPVFLTALLQFFDLSRFYNGTGVPTLNRNIVHKERIIVIPRKEQDRFAAFVEQTDKSKVLMEKSQKIVQMLIKLIFQLTKIDIEYCNDRKIYSDML